MLCLHGLSVLRFYQAFKDSLQLDPRARENPDQPARHLFINKVEEACYRAEVSLETFTKWQEEVEHAFMSRNSYALSLERAPNGMSIEAQPLLERLKVLEEVCKNTGDKVAQFDNILREIVSLQKKQEARMDRLEQILANQMLRSNNSPVLPPPPSIADSPADTNGDGVVDPPSDHDNPQQETPGFPTPFPDQTPTPLCYDIILQQRYKDQTIPVPKMFLAWFREQLPVTYENYKAARIRGDDPRRKDPKYHKSVKTHFSICKTAVHVLLKNLDNYPTVGDDLEALADKALKNLCERHNLSKIPPRSQLAGKSNSIFKQGDYGNLPFPENTPANIQRYFAHRGFHDNGRPNRQQSGTANEPPEAANPPVEEEMAVEPAP